jgi:hypothetical protein
MTTLGKAKFFILFLIFASCTEKNSEIEFEKKVMTEILPSLVDSTCFDRRSILNFPPASEKAIFEKGRFVKTDSTINTIEQELKLSEWKKKTSEIKHDTAKIILAFDPKMKINNEKVDEDFAKHFQGAKIFKLKPEDDAEYLLDYENIQFNYIFKLMNINEFPKGDKIWDYKYSFNFSGVVNFTRIEFDKDKKFGILDGSFNCGAKCGKGFRIYIKMKNNKWIVDKVDPTWIS